jgi:plastin-1
MKRGSFRVKIKSGGGGIHHSFHVGESYAYIHYINKVLAGNPITARHLPLGLNPNELFDEFSDGLILCALINYANPGTIDARAINKKDKISVFQTTENLNLALNAAKSIGCQVVNIGAADIASGNPILILGLIWQIIKIQLMSKISLKERPELVLLFAEGEDAAAFNKLSSEEVLVRWVNYHLTAAGSEKRIRNFGSDITDGEAYNVLLHQLGEHECALIRETDPLVCAERVMDNARRIGIDPFISPKDIVDGDRKLNLAFTAQLFRNRHGLVMPVVASPAAIAFAAHIAEVAAVKEDEDSQEGSVLKLWVNALNIEDLYVNDFFADMDTFNILKVMDTVQPGIVEWKR